MTATNPRRIHIGNRNFNPSQWTDFGWNDPRHGPQIKGEVAVIRDDGTSGSLQCGLWRTGVGLAGCAPDRSASVRRASPRGDETMLLLEGQAQLVNDETGEIYHLEGGDVIGLPAGLPVTWTSRGPYLKLFRVTTRAA